MAPARPTSPAARPSILFISGFQKLEDGSRLYRCAYQAKQLRNAGMRAEVVYEGDATLDMIRAADVVVMARCKLNEANLALARATKEAGKFLCGELDDKIFEPWDVGTSGFLRSKALVRRDLAAAGRLIGAERNTLGLLPIFDLIVVSTPGLKEALESIGMAAHVARNALDTDIAAPLARERQELRRLLVMSGTETHDADLRLIAAPLARFLYENPSIKCTFLGPLRLAGVLLGLPNIERVARLPIAELYPFVAQHDLCLVPLEDTRFNDCKSAIKFVECGLVSVPVIASPRREFRDVIRDGETGFLAADDPNAWYHMLCTLRDRPQLLKTVAANAHRAVLAEHTVVSRGTSLAEHLTGLLRKHVEQARTKQRSA